MGHPKKALKKKYVSIMSLIFDPLVIILGTAMLGFVEQQQQHQLQQQQQQQQQQHAAAATIIEDFVQ